MKYTYTLRYSFDPRANTPEKDQKLLNFVKKAKIDDVAFFINGEELNHSHLTKEEIQFWLDAIKPLQAQLAKLNVTTSLNPWTTIMHSDRGYSVNPKIGFKTFVDINGDQAHDMACPVNPTWRKYITECYAQYASIHPTRLWMEDDFRHYNHTPLKLMCFCDQHMKIYQEKLGKKESREEFVKNMLKPGKPTPERKVYLDQARQEMIENEHLIEQAVHAVSPETNLAQMTSFPEWHAIEGRDWSKLFDAQAGSGHPRIGRPHLPAYNEDSPLIYGRHFEEYSRITAAYLGNKAEIYPELENSMWTPQVKSNRFIAFQIITTCLLGAKGIMLNLFDMAGNGINDHWHYGEMLAEIKPFLEKLRDHKLNLDNLRGIKVLVDQDSAYTIHTSEGKQPEEMLPHEKNWVSLLAQFGFATTVLPVNKDIELKGETIAIAGQLLRNFNNSQIEHLLKNNTVLLDGESVQVLLDRGLDNLLHIKHAEWHQCKTGYQSFEQADGMTVQGVENPRVTMNQHTGNYLKIDYDHDSNVKVCSWAYSSLDEKLGNVMAIVDDHIIVMPTDQDPKHGWEAEFSTYKQGILQQMMDKVKPVDYLDVGISNVKLNVQADGKVIWISSFSLDDYDQLKLHLSQPLASSKATLVRKSGTKEITISTDGQWTTIDEPLGALETVQLIFE